MGAQRREFEERFRAWKMLEMTKKGTEQNEQVTLKRWQKSVHPKAGLIFAGKHATIFECFNNMVVHKFFL
jgi:hypothetical protein